MMEDLFQFFPALNAEGTQRIDVRLQRCASEILNGNRRASVFLCDQCNEILRSFNYRSGGVEPNASNESIKLDEIVQILVLRFLGGRAYIQRRAELDELCV